MPFLSLVTLTLTLTFQLIRARDQTRLPCEFGTNLFSGSRNISYINKKHRLTAPKNRTFLSSLCEVKTCFAGTRLNKNRSSGPNSAYYWHYSSSDSISLTLQYLFPYCYMYCNTFLWLPYVIGQTIIFLPCGFYLVSFFFFFSSPNLSGRRLDVYHTSTHGVALMRT